MLGWGAFFITAGGVPLAVQAGALSPGALDRAWSAWPLILEHGSLTMDGLMTMAPHADDPAAARPAFRGLRKLRDRLREVSGGRCQLPDLSMGMSGDFEIGIEEGATLIRVGSSLFEGLTSA